LTELHLAQLREQNLKETQTACTYEKQQRSFCKTNGISASQMISGDSKGVHMTNAKEIFD